MNLDKKKQELFIGSEYIFKMRGDIDMLLELKPTLSASQVQNGPSEPLAMYQVESYEQLKKILRENSETGGDQLEDQYLRLYDRLLNTLDE